MIGWGQMSHEMRDDYTVYWADYYMVTGQSYAISWRTFALSMELI